jgi:hypothetical protein
MSLHGKQRRAAGNSHRPSGNALERGTDALAKLKKLVDRCVTPLCASARWAGLRPIFCPNLDANGSKRIVYIDRIRRSAVSGTHPTNYYLYAMA